METTTCNNKISSNQIQSIFCQSTSCCKKLFEAWKTVNRTHYPIQLEPNNRGREDFGRKIRSTSIKIWKHEANTKAASESFSRGTAKLWNNAPMKVFFWGFLKEDLFYFL